MRLVLLVVDLVDDERDAVDHFARPSARPSSPRRRDRSPRRRRVARGPPSPARRLACWETFPSRLSPDSSQPPVSTTSKVETAPLDLDGLAVARDAALLFDDREALARETVDERTLADVRSPDDDDLGSSSRSTSPSTARPTRGPRRKSCPVVAHAR